MLATGSSDRGVGDSDHTRNPEAADFIEMVAVRNSIEAALVGSTALNYSPAELLPVYLSQGFSPKRMFVARIDGRIVGRAVIEWSLAEGSSSSWVTAEVLPAHRGRGIGGALFDMVESVTVAAGRPILQSEILHTATTWRRPAALTHRIRRSTDQRPRRPFSHRTRIPVGTDRPGQLSRSACRLVGAGSGLRAARAAAGDEYALVSWTGRTPAERIDDLVVLGPG